MYLVSIVTCCFTFDLTFSSRRHGRFFGAIFARTGKRSHRREAVRDRTASTPRSLDGQRSIRARARPHRPGTSTPKNGRDQRTYRSASQSAWERQLDREDGPFFSGAVPGRPRMMEGRSDPCSRCIWVDLVPQLFLMVITSACGVVAREKYVTRSE